MESYRQPMPPLSGNNNNNNNNNNLPYPSLPPLVSFTASRRAARGGPSKFTAFMYGTLAVTEVARNCVAQQVGIFQHFQGTSLWLPGACLLNFLMDKFWRGWGRGEFYLFASESSCIGL